MEKIEILEEKVAVLQEIVGQLQDELRKKVDADGVVSAINISPEGIRLRGNKIEIDRNNLIDYGSNQNRPDGVILVADRNSKFDLENGDLFIKTD